MDRSRSPKWLQQWKKNSWRERTTQSNGLEKFSKFGKLEKNTSFGRWCSETGDISLDLEHRFFFRSRGRVSTAATEAICCILDHGRSESLHLKGTTDTLQLFFQWSAESTLIDSERICLFCVLAGGQLCFSCQWTRTQFLMATQNYPHLCTNFTPTQITPIFRGLNMTYSGMARNRRVTMFWLWWCAVWRGHHGGNV